MNTQTTKRTFILLCVFSLSGMMMQCTSGPATKDAGAATTGENSPASAEKRVERGKYLVHTSGCRDCHSPKLGVNPDGTFKFDEEKPLSGHPAGTQLPPIDTNVIKPGMWILGSEDLTSWVGPWGITYAANLTPDTVTGLGNWTEEVFIATMRTGKHLGHEHGRPVMPPMPWYELRNMTDEDLKSIFAYLKSLKPVTNQVPTNVPPPGMAAMVSGKK